MHVHRSRAERARYLVPAVASHDVEDVQGFWKSVQVWGVAWCGVVRCGVVVVLMRELHALLLLLLLSGRCDGAGG